MSRLTMTTAMALSLSAFAVPATADFVAPEPEDGPTLILNGTDNDPITDDRDFFALILTENAAIIRDEGRPVQLGGSNQAVGNFGLIESGDDDAIRATGANLTVDNAGTIRAGDRGIRLQDGADGFTLNNLATGEIFSRRQAVRLDNDDLLEGAVITNDGLIESTEGRAIQTRGPGGRVINRGTLLGGEEVVEAREDFYIENHGTIAIRGLDWDPETRTWTKDASIAVEDEDGVQVASGEAHNHGVILSTDDGIDIDEGLVHNYATGVIVSAGPLDDASKGGIDVDALFETQDGTSRPAGPLTIINEGYIEGPRAIATDEDSTSEITIENSGTLFGRAGTAIDLAPGQGNSSLTLTGDSEIIGDVILGGGDDRLIIGDVNSGPMINSVFDGGAGNDTVVFSQLMLDSVTTARFTPDRVSLGLTTDNGLISGDFRNFGFWQFGDDAALTTSALRSALPQAVVVSLPAGLPLLITALGGLAWLRRRSRA